MQISEKKIQTEQSPLRKIHKEERLEESNAKTVDIIDFRKQTTKEKIDEIYIKIKDGVIKLKNMSES